MQLLVMQIYSTKKYFSYKTAIKTKILKPVNSYQHTIENNCKVLWNLCIKITWFLIPGKELRKFLNFISIMRMTHV